MESPVRIIICDTTFLDGRDRFEAGERLATEGGQGCRVITDEQATRFVDAKWAHDGDGEGAALASGDATLQVQSITHQTAVTHG